MPDRACPVCGNPVEASPPAVICNPHNCPSWKVTHVYDKRTRTWVPESSSGGRGAPTSVPAPDTPDLQAHLAESDRIIFGGGE